MVLSLIRLIQSFSQKIRDDYVSAFSAQAAFFLIMSFFPFAMFLLTMLNYLPVSKADIFATIEAVLPQAISGYFSELMSELLEKSSGAVLSVTAIAALWSSSKGFYSIVRGLNSIYKSSGNRNYFVTRLLSALYTLLFALLLIIVLFIFVFGNQFYLWSAKHFPLLSDMALLIISVRTIAGLGLLTLFFTLMFKSVPNRKSTFWAELPGAILTSAGWMGFSYLYSYYIDNFSNYSATYGSLTAIVLCMLWIYACMYIMFIGSEVNQILSNPVIHNAFRNLRTIQKKRRSSRKAMDASKEKRL